MPDSYYPTIVLPLGTVGLQTDLPIQARTLTHYTTADNILFENGSQVRKFGGAEKVNSSAIAGANILGGIDYWKGGGGTPFTQKFVVVTSNGKIWKEDMDGVYDDITGATVVPDAMPVFCVAGGLLTIWFATGIHTPIKWNQAGNAAVLGGNPPSCKGAIYAYKRLFAWLGSRLYYPAAGNIEDWNGVDSGSIDIQPDDGDEIVGCVFFKKNIFIFKGPNIGSIWTLSGSSPTGSDAFVLNAFSSGIPLQSPNAIVPLGSERSNDNAADVAFMSPRGIHMLSSVQQYGDFQEADVTRFLKRHFRELNRNYFTKCWGVNYREKSCLLWATTRGQSVVNDQIFGLSYARLQEDGFKAFTVTRQCTSLALRKNPLTRIDELVTGNSDGFVRIQDTDNRNIDGVAYNENLVTPRLILASADKSGKSRGDQPVVLDRCYVRADATGSYKLAATIERDNVPGENYQFGLGIDVPGFILDLSQLDIDTLGGDAIEISYSAPAVMGECRTARFSFNQNGLNQDASLIELGIECNPAAQSNLSPTERG